MLQSILIGGANAIATTLMRRVSQGRAIPAGLEDGGGPIHRAIVNHQNLVNDSPFEHRLEALEEWADVLLFVIDGKEYYDSSGHSLM